ncbi:MAG TPA: ABC transporter substrate-binding protein, partial [Rhizomicrobium sp.]|nr:ABC transporter substrate-binding protein [Rhizomicrobium sp.]
MSLKVCTDELLLDLVPPSRIASITFLSQEKAALKVWPQAARIPVNHGTAEEILKLHPDLILTDPFMAPSLRPLLAKSGAKIVEVPPAENFDQIRNVTRMVAHAVGEESRGEALIARMDADLADLAAHRPKKMLTVAGWGGGGYVPGTGGLFDAMLTEAGARNVERGSFGYYDV